MPLDAGSYVFETPNNSELILASELNELTFRRYIKPDWASAIGRDQYGLWVEFKINDVIQRMRWIPPGEFLMGSPKDEPGRRDNERPTTYGAVE